VLAPEQRGRVLASYYYLPSTSSDESNIYKGRPLHSLARTTDRDTLAPNPSGIYGGSQRYALVIALYRISSLDTQALCTCTGTIGDLDRARLIVILNHHIFFNKAHIDSICNVSFGQRQRRRVPGAFRQDTPAARPFCCVR
jgi:hypothetical protein